MSDSSQCSLPEDDEFLRTCRKYQSRIMDHYDTLDSSAKKHLLEDLKKYPPSEWNLIFHKIAKEAKLQDYKPKPIVSNVPYNSPSPATAEQTYLPPVYRYPTLQSDNQIAFPLGHVETYPCIVTAADGIDNEIKNRYKKEGFSLIGKGRVGVVLLASGQNTRLGIHKAKGFVKATPLSGKSLFQVLCERMVRVMALSKETNTFKTEAKCPLYVMTSFHTHDIIEKFFKEHSYFGLNAEYVKFFQQSVSPCFDKEGNFLLSSESTIATNPDGNGGVFKALEDTGVLTDMKKKELRYIHFVGIDNLLCKIMDPLFIGFLTHSKAEIGNKVVLKEEPLESIGMFCSRIVNEINGEPLKAPFRRACVVEYSELTPSMCNQKNPINGALTFSCGNICNHLFSLKSIQNVIDSKVMFQRFHIAHKKVPYYDVKTKGMIEPKSPNAYKLEHFIFDAFEAEPFVLGLEVSREAEFSPIKNRKGNDSLESARLMMSCLHKTWLKTNEWDPNEEDEVNFCEISPLLSYEGENLEAYKKVPISFPHHINNDSFKD